jgi:type VI secretion system secreted protein Hcp
MFVLEWSEPDNQQWEPIMPIYLEYDSGKVKGDVTAEGHEKWIEVNSFQWGLGRAICTRPGKVADRESSAPSIREITVTKALDDSTVRLMQEALTGEGVWAQIDFSKTDKGKLEVYASYLMENCMISDYSASSDGDRPQEALTLNFTAIECKVIPMGGDGSGGDSSSVTYDLATAKT